MSSLHPQFRQFRRAVAIAPLILAAAGCSGVQSSLDPAGFEAAKVGSLFWLMLIGAVGVWVAVVALAAFAAMAPPRRTETARALIWGGGLIFPTLVLAALLVHGLALLPVLRAPAGDLRIAVSGEQYWWRITYLDRAGEPLFETANQLRLPVGERVELILTSPDVIHSLWIPALAGKVDMIPGRTTRLVVEPTRPGRFRGQCAELCGVSHANMALTVDVLEPDEFTRWVARAGGDGTSPVMPQEIRGRDLFLRTGCGACHTIRGTTARGVMGPDLTRIGARDTIGAGMAPNTIGNVASWIRSARHLKPGNRMPSFEILSEPESHAIASYLASLQ